MRTTYLLQYEHDIYMYNRYHIECICRIPTVLKIQTDVAKIVLCTTTEQDISARTQKTYVQSGRRMKKISLASLAELQVSTNKPILMHTDRSLKTHIFTWECYSYKDIQTTYYSDLHMYIQLTVGLYASGRIYQPYRVYLIVAKQCA